MWIIMMFSFIYCSDVKVKLNSSDGSTSFQVLDAGNVVVSSITSDGRIEVRYGVKAATIQITGTAPDALNIGEGAIKDGMIIGDDIKASVLTSTHILDGSIKGSDIKDMEISSPKLIINSSITLFTQKDWFSNTTSGSWNEYPPFMATFNISTVPAMVYAVYTSSVSREVASGWPRFQVRFMQGTTQFGYGGILYPAGQANDFDWYVSAYGVMEITNPGTYTFRLQEYHWADPSNAMEVENARFAIWWWPIAKP